MFVDASDLVSKCEKQISLLETKLDLDLNDSNVLTRFFLKGLFKDIHLYISTNGCECNGVHSGNSLWEGCNSEFLVCKWCWGRFCSNCLYSNSELCTFCAGLLRREGD